MKRGLSRSWSLTRMTFAWPINLHIYKMNPQKDCIGAQNDHWRNDSTDLHDENPIHARSDTLRSGLDRMAPIVCLVIGAGA